jgi:hypothetical protein
MRRVWVLSWLAFSLACFSVAAIAFATEPGRARAEDPERYNCPPGFVWQRMSGTGCVQEKLPDNARWSYEGYGICNEGYTGVYERRATTDGLPAPGTPYTSFAFLIKCVTPEEYERLQKGPAEELKNKIFVKSGIGEQVLKPGVGPPPDAGVPGSAVFSGVLGLVAAGSIPGQIGAAKLRRKLDKEKRRLGQRTLRAIGVSDSVIAKVKDPYGTTWRLLKAGQDPRLLGRTISDELARDPVLAHEVLTRVGIDAGLIAALGGPERTIRIIKRVVRNPFRATGEFIEDVGHNLADPRRLVGHIVGPPVRAARDTVRVVGDVVKDVGQFFGRVFRRRRAPRPGSR